MQISPNYDECKGNAINASSNKLKGVKDENASNSKIQFVDDSPVVTDAMNNEPDKQGTTPNSKRKRRKRPRRYRKNTALKSIEEWIAKRPPVEELLIRNILKTEESVHPKALKTSFERFFESRPTRQELVSKNVIAGTKLAHSLRETQQELMRKLQRDTINRSLKHRPTLEYLMQQNIIRDPPSPNSVRNPLHHTEQVLSSLLMKRPTVDELREANVIQDVYVWSKIHPGHRPSVRNCHTITACNDRLYLLGGVNGSSNTQKTQHIPKVYDFFSNSWHSTKYNGLPPDSRYAHTAVEINNRVYVFGGYATDGQSVRGRWMNDIHILSVAAKPYSENNNNNNYNALTNDSEDINDGKKPHDDLEKTPEDNATNAVPSHSHLEVSIANDHKDTNGDNNSPCPASIPTIHKLNKIKIYWNRVVIPRPRPAPRAAHTCAAVSDHMFIFGGNDGGMLYNDTWKLDTIKLKWQHCNTSGTAPSPRAGHSATIFQQRMYVFGGGGGWGGATNNDLHVLDTESLVWYRPKFDGMPPSPRAGHSATLYRNKLFIFAGGDLSRVFNDLFLLDLDTMTWSRPTDAGSLPCSRVGHGTSLVGQHLVVFGGGDNEGRLFNDMFVLDLGESEDYLREKDEYYWDPNLTRKHSGSTGIDTIVSDTTSTSGELYPERTNTSLQTSISSTSLLSLRSKRSSLAKEPSSGASTPTTPTTATTGSTFVPRKATYSRRLSNVSLSNNDESIKTLINNSRNNNSSVNEPFYGSGSGIEYDSETEISSTAHLLDRLILGFGEHEIQDNEAIQNRIEAMRLCVKTSSKNEGLNASEEGVTVENDIASSMKSSSNDKIIKNFEELTESITNKLNHQDRLWGGILLSLQQVEASRKTDRSKIISELDQLKDVILKSHETNAAT